jgi:hypothetical protein
MGGNVAVTIGGINYHDRMSSNSRGGKQAYLPKLGSTMKGGSDAKSSSMRCQLEILPVMPVRTVCESDVKITGLMRPTCLLAVVTINEASARTSRC